jgi:hypothetical protein
MPAVCIPQPGINAPMLTLWIGLVLLIGTAVGCVSAAALIAAEIRGK